jgi:hypothetical protein
MRLTRPAAAVHGCVETTIIGGRVGPSSNQGRPHRGPPMHEVNRPVARSRRGGRCSRACPPSYGGRTHAPFRCLGFLPAAELRHEAPDETSAPRRRPGRSPAASRKNLILHVDPSYSAAPKPSGAPAGLRGGAERARMREQLHPSGWRCQALDLGSKGDIHDRLVPGSKRPGALAALVRGLAPSPNCDPEAAPSGGPPQACLHGRGRGRVRGASGSDDGCTELALRLR